MRKALRFGGGVLAGALSAGVFIAAPLHAQCKTKPPIFLSITGNPRTVDVNALYWNWTNKEAHDFRIQLEQVFPPGKAPAEPKVSAPPFTAGKIEKTDKQEGEGEEARVRRTIVYKFDGVTVGPGKDLQRWRHSRVRRC